MNVFIIWAYDLLLSLIKVPLLAYSVDIYSHEPSSLFHHSNLVDVNVSAFML